MLKNPTAEAGPRYRVLPEPHFAELAAVLAERLEQVAGRITPVDFGSILDALTKDVLQQGLNEIGAHEGTIWLLDDEEQNLIPAYNTGPNADRFVGRFRQPLDRGLVSMVFASEQPFIENEVHRNARQSRELDSLLELKTQSLIALPFYFLKRCRGVVSCVQLAKPGESARLEGFTQEHLRTMHRTAGIITRLLELVLIARTIGWEVES